MADDANSKSISGLFLRALNLLNLKRCDKEPSEEEFVLGIQAARA